MMSDVTVTEGEAAAAAAAAAPTSKQQQDGNSGKRGNGGSRESSEFEFIEGKAGQGQATAAATIKTPTALPPPPAPIPTPASAAAATLPTATVQSPPVKLNSPKAAAVKDASLASAGKSGHSSTSSDQTGQGDGVDDGGSLFGWVKGASGGILSKVAEKTKSSVESVITTLDPQMKEFIHSGGDVTVIVASDRDAKVSAVRQAFQDSFGRATVYGLPVRHSDKVAEQPVGFAAGRQGAAERIRMVRERAEPGDAVVAVEGFLLEVGDDEWVEMSCLQLQDEARGVSLTCYSQPTPVDPALVARAKDMTPESYPLRWSGLAVPVGGLAAEAWGVNKEEWQEAAVGVSRREALTLASKCLAGLYKRALMASRAD